ncbi:hypothetical protein [Bartonella taylorii]|uniref:hypothetical protein n=1 Tax=Bartonella taylorii TaxID=33046 RepID=UPI001ABB86B8|nr:hypothetical protein [Bartonella taylorii]
MSERDYESIKKRAQSLSVFSLGLLDSRGKMLQGCVLQLWVSVGYVGGAVVWGGGAAVWAWLLGLVRLWCFEEIGCEGGCLIEQA